MNAKLTLKLNLKTIERAKKYAKKNNQSLSAMVENYFNLILDKDCLSEIKISPNVLDLSGIIKLPENFNMIELYGEYLEGKIS